MATHHRVDRLSLQIDSLQEGFDHLSRSGSLKELARRFFHFLRGNLVTSDITILHKQLQEDSWRQLFGKDLDADEYFSDIPEKFQLKGFGGKLPKIAVAQPLLDRSCIGVVFGRKLGGATYSALDKISLQIFLQLFASAYQAFLQQRKEKELVFSLNHRLLQLSSLINTGIDLTRVKTESSLETLALERAASATNASWGMFRRKIRNGDLETLRFPEGTRQRPPKDKQLRIHSRFTFQDSTYTFHLYEKESRGGTVPFEEADKMLLDAVTRQVHAVIENRFLQKEELEKQRIEQDIALAASIQQRILPKALPVLEGYELFGVNIPTKLVGGDYYDALRLENGTFALVIADVAGKGVPAALLVSSFHAYLSAFVERDVSLVELAHELNRAMFKSSTAERYITALIAMFDPAKGTLNTINAGHNPAYLLRNDGTMMELNAGGVAFGMLDMDFPYESDSVSMESGDRLLFYTDGVTEAMDAKGRLYDRNGALQQFMTHHRTDSAEIFIRDLMADVNTFTGSAAQSDDITAMFLMRK